MTCSRCGAPRDVVARFCSSCGGQFVPSPTLPYPPPQEDYPPQQDFPPQPSSPPAAVGARRPSTRARPRSARTQAQGSALSAAGFALGVVAVLLAPVLFGTLAVVCAVLALTRRQAHAAASFAVAVSGTSLGLVVGALFGPHIP